MVRAIRQSVVVKPGGLIEVRSGELRPGATAEVIVLVDSSDPAPAASASADDGIALLNAAQRAAKLKPKDAAAWADRARRQRTAGSRRHEPPGR